MKDHYQKHLNEDIQTTQKSFSCKRQNTNKHWTKSNIIMFFVIFAYLSLSKPLDNN